MLFKKQERKQRYAKKEVDTRKAFGKSRKREPMRTIPQNTRRKTKKNEKELKIKEQLYNDNRIESTNNFFKKSIERKLLRIKEGTEDSIRKAEVLRGVNEELIEEGFKEQLDLEEKVKESKLKKLENEYTLSECEIQSRKKRNLPVKNKKLFRYSDETKERIEKAYNTLKDDKTKSYSMIVEIFQHQHNKEHFDRPHYGFLRAQAELDEDMRRMIWNWMIAIHNKLALTHPSLILALNVVDRYCSHKKVNRDKYYLLAITAVFVAAKYEEIYFPTLRDLCYLCKNKIAKESIIKMERLILCTLNFKLTVVHPEKFLFKSAIAFKGIVSKKVFPKIYSACQMFLEIALSCYEVLKYEPSRIAAGVCCVVGRLLLPKTFSWDKNFELFAGYKDYDLKPLVKCIKKEAQLLMNDRCHFSAIKRKYSSPVHNGVTLDVLDKMFGNVTREQRSQYQKLEKEYKRKIEEKKKAAKKALEQN